ncbi:MAG: T9SS type A sorting domain-containing protein [Crocinitomicaceae bacterium]|nr:T9SS type A sorting domain-containing protein [Crocinitomicaceae bacterium]
MLDFDPSEEVFDLLSNGNTDVYILKLHSNGNFAWAKSFGGIHADNSREISLDASGNLYITGTFFEAVDFDPDAGVINITSSGSGSDLFVLKLDQLALELDESEIFEGVKVFPNPNEGLIHLGLDHLKDVEVKIFNSNGQLIYHEINVNELVHQIELIGPAGFYLMEVRLPNGKNNTKGLTQHYKIVKQ